MKRVITTIVGIVILFVVLVVVVSYFILNNGSFLTNFKFKSITNTGLDFYVYFEKSKAAVNYDVIVYNMENEVIYKENIKDNSTTVKFDKLNFNENYKIIVIAYDKDGNKKSVKEPYTFIWNNLSFSNNNMVVMDNENDYNVYFVGDYNEKDYKLSIKENGVYKETIDINSDEYIIKNSEFKNKEVYYTLEILDNNIAVSTLNIYNLIYLFLCLLKYLAIFLTSQLVLLLLHI